MSEDLTQYPKMLFQGDITNAETEPPEGSTLVVQDEESEKAAKKEGWKAAKKSKNPMDELDTAKAEIVLLKELLKETQAEAKNLKKPSSK
jgi:hypothetical protein